jgi:hypothetical protein
MAAPIAPVSPDIPSRSAPEADFDVKMFALFKWATDDFVSFMEAWRSYLETNSTIVGGALNGTTIGQTTPAAGAFTELLAANLGGAAVQSSPTDTTASKVLLNGGHGLGGVGINATNGDCNDITASGLYTFDSETLNSPSFTLNGTILHIARTADIHTQLAISRASSSLGRFAVRAVDSATGWSEWREGYTQGSILGTVSQSGGVPTGALIQRGSNANGEYVRLADGTQYVWSVVSVDVTTTGTQTFTLPAAFVTDSVGSIHPASASHLTDPNSALYLSNIRQVRATNSAFNIRLASAGTSVDPGGITEQLVLRAEGRWF